jgi:serine/threonine protein kinase
VATATSILPPRYRDVEPVGRGAMGDIYRATDTALGRTVAAKLLADRYADDADIVARFEREARTAARLSGTANVVTVYDVGAWNGRPYLVMQYLPGGSLADRLSGDETISPGVALRWLEQTARGLDAAHAAGIVHRDVKPANMLLDEADSVRVADFGIARAVDTDSLTITGTVLGTAGYIAPEQARGERAAPASDRYALGVVAFELLTGSRPFERESTTAEALAHMSSPVPSVSEFRPGLPRALDAVFERALAKEPEERYPSCLELVSALRDAMASGAGETAAFPVVPPPAPPLEARPAPPRRRRWPWGLALAGLALAAAGGLAAGFLLSSGSDQVRTLTIHGRTVQQTVHQTVTAPAPPPPAPPSPVVSGEPHDLNDRGYSLMQEGKWSAALPLLHGAVRGLEGAGPSDPYEGYANYNLGYTLNQVGHCSEALTFLRRADRLEPHNHDVLTAIARAQRC